MQKALGLHDLQAFIMSWTDHAISSNQPIEAFLHPSASDDPLIATVIHL